MLQFSPDSKVLVICGQDGTARLWEAASGRSIGKVLKHPFPMRTAVFTPDGKTLVTGSVGGGKAP